MVRHRYLLLGILLGLLGLGEVAWSQESPQPSPAPGVPLVLRIDLENEVISPGITRYIFRALDEAEARNAECLIITLDTPGGLLESTREIVKRFLQSRVCVVVYVAPTGARAASAGVFITMAAHVAAMAPATTIGAARPVAIGGFSPRPSGPADEERAPGSDGPFPLSPLPLPGGYFRGLTIGGGLPSLLRPVTGSPLIWDGSLLTLRPIPDGELWGLGASSPLVELDFPWQSTVPSGESLTQAQTPAASNQPEASSTGVDATKEVAPGESKPSAETSKGSGRDGDSKVSSADGEKEAEKRPRETSPMEEKIVNDTVSWAQALAKQRGRNADWIAKAVRESSSITAEEAAANGVVDFLAEDFSQLLEKLEGRTVKLLQGEKTLRVRGAVVEKIEMWWGERILSIVSHPQVAFLLLLFGIYGVLYELFSPGWGVPGTVGVICLLLGLFGLSVLPVNYLGLALLVVAVGLFIAEAFVPSFGLLALAGVICMTLGALMLIDSPPGFTDIPLPLVLAVSLATAVIFLFIVGATVRAHRRQVLTGDESLAGRVAQAKTEFKFENGRYEGKVLFEGEWWKAYSKTPVAEGETCRIIFRDGLALWVEPSSKQTASS
ncbi:MAG: nodulation protein NfeD [Thermoguttaceae bacterium]|nr:nodulation protein NfeD [Thermoguttaceae bacterium]